MTNQTPEQRLAAIGLALPSAPVPVANYVPYRLAGNLLFLSGQGPRRLDGSYEVGRLGKDATIEDGYRANARSAVGMGSLPNRMMVEIEAIMLVRS
jgi:enamine deaminase RidA (YjgF/YER057c/UK114 family)